jgi:hypothetical protein
MSWQLSSKRGVGGTIPGFVPKGVVPNAPRTPAIAVRVLIFEEPRSACARRARLIAVGGALASADASGLPILGGCGPRLRQSIPCLSSV